MHVVGFSNSRMLKAIPISVRVVMLTYPENDHNGKILVIGNNYNLILLRVSKFREDKRTRLKKLPPCETVRF